MYNNFDAHLMIAELQRYDRCETIKHQQMIYST